MPGLPRPGWQEVLAVYLDAARGLAAAHAKGVVHRDVKPSNILRGDDGRGRVADFGIASALAGEDPDETRPAPPARAEDERLTATGAVLGTPLYMAPEQHEGAGATAASDQYGLCLALYEGLYGRLPFALPPGAGPAALLAKKKAGAPQPAPPDTPVPRWVHRALARGLAPAPVDRYPSMDALLAALGEDPDARRRTRRRSAGIGAAAAVLIAIGAAAWLRGASSDPCAHAERQLGGVWDEGVRGRVRAAFLGTGRSYAGDTATRVTAILDRYGASWASMRGEVCEASRQGTQRRALAGLRDECLDGRLGQIRALTGVFAEGADVQVLDRAVQAAAALPPIAACADTEALTARVRPPEDPALRAQVAALQPRVDRIEALHKAGKYQEGLPLGEALLSEVGSIPFPPLRAQVEHWVGELKIGVGDFEGAKTLLRAAAASAAEGRDDVLAALCWARVLYVLGERQRRFDEGSVVRTFGPTVVGRARDPRTEVSWLDAEGLFLLRKGQYGDAKAVHERAVAIAERVWGPDHPEVATPLNDLGLVLREMGELPGARAVYERALAIREKALGPDHPQVAASLNNLAMVLKGMGEWAPARAGYGRALAIWEQALGPDHPYVGQVLNNLGGLLFRQGEWPEARAALERSLAIREKASGPDSLDVAQTLYSLGALLREVDLAASSTALRRARTISEKVLGPDHADVAYSWAPSAGRWCAGASSTRGARILLERALMLREKALGPSNAAVAEPLLGLGELHLARGKPQEAAPPLERALAVREEEGSGDIELTLADALWQIGSDRPRAVALAEQARAYFARIGHRPRLDRAARWLADHAKP